MTKAYTVTTIAGPHIAGKSHGPAGSTIALTPEEARYELLLGSIIDPDLPPSSPSLPRALKATDVLTLRSDGIDVLVTVGQLAAYLGATSVAPNPTAAFSATVFNPLLLS